MSRRFLYMVVGNCWHEPSSYTLHRINPSRLFFPKDSPERAAAAAAAGARATTMEAAEAAARARMTAMKAAAAAEDKRARRARLLAAMWNRATKRTKADDTKKARLPVPRMNFSSPGIVMDFALIGQSKDKIVVVDGANPDYTRDDWQYESGHRGLLCAWDLNSVKDGGAAAPLVARGVWEGFGAPSGSFNVRSRLVHLGDGGRFCVAKLYKMDKPLPAWVCRSCFNDGMPVEMNFAMLTGVEVERCDGGELRMIKHRSCKYSFGEYNFPHALL